MSYEKQFIGFANIPPDNRRGANDACCFGRRFDSKRNYLIAKRRLNIGCERNIPRRDQLFRQANTSEKSKPVSYTHLRAHET
jgi:hypothetical protein